MIPVRHRPPALPGPPASTDPGAPSAGRRRDLLAAGAALLLFAAVAVVGGLLDHRRVLVSWPPLTATWEPHAGPGTPAAVAVAVLVVGYGPAVARRLPWRWLTPSAWAAAAAWTWSLALIDGWRRGVAGRLTEPGEYLRGIGHFHDAGSALRGFTGHILAGTPQSWETHVIGHPPLAVLTFVGLDRVGLGGGAWAGAFCITVGSAVVPAVLVTLRALGGGDAGERTARTAAPFLVLTPGAIWVGASADGYFAAVAAWALALLAVAATASSVGRAAAAGLGSGLLFGAALYLSYGLVLLVIPALAVLLCAAATRGRRSPGGLPVAVAAALSGVGCAVLSFTLAGFDWWEGYRLLRVRYYQGWGGIRPYAYWVWGNAGATVAAIGLACAAGLRRAVLGAPGALRRWRAGHAPVETLLPCAMLLALLAADLSGMSKAETERIWLPFTLWLPMTAALLPARDRRGWLIAQATVALLLNHLLLTVW
ncbi:hypothetical protein [Actinacidiphila alni]|uniref:hypothetical protein n=1 Tax=Actinacidiphila alni TaxID=380248 RepID=UPI003F4F8DDE